MQIECRHRVFFDGGWTAAGVRTMLEASQCTVLVAHVHADGDAVGSLTGMYALLRHVRCGEVTMMLPDGVPEELAWLPNTEEVLSGRTDEARCREAVERADLIVGLDISGFGRTGVLAEMLAHAAARTMLIDHHIGPDKADMVVSEPEISSTCELVYWLMREAYGREAFTAEAAESLYTGLCTDTGNFSYSNTHASLYLAAAELSEAGIDPMDIGRKIRNVFTLPRLRLFGHAMAERLTVYDERKVALMVLSAKDIASYGVDDGELTGLINEVMKLRDIDCGVLVREERDGTVRLSLRSKTLYDVNRIAGEMFGGGGHERAAGATSNAGLEETVEIVKRTLRIED